MSKEKQTAIDWFFDKIKSNFEHDGDLFESLCFTFSIAKQKENEQINNAYSTGANDRLKGFIRDYYNEQFGNEK